MPNTITPTVFYRTLNVKGLEIFYREAGFDDRTIVIDNAPTAAGSPYEAWKWQLPLRLSASRRIKIAYRNRNVAGRL
jgi:hypothetical protein